jgi:glyoxylase-like metal-dependent hydrolase (beta-lactamase superfamily II)
MAPATGPRAQAGDRGPLRADRRRSARVGNLEILDGDQGEIEPGIRWLLTPGHSDGLISLLVDTDDGLVVIASDCVGPLPEYFDQMDLSEDFGPEREEPLEQWPGSGTSGPRS